jgi:predicted RND superfamily exporter protein
MRRSFATALYRWRIPLSVFIVAGAVAFAPLVNITDIDNDLTAWFSKDDPVYRDYERFRSEFGGTRTLIVALRSEKLFTREALRFIEDVTAAIERVPAVQRVQSLATANIVQALPPDRPDDAGGIEVRPLLDRVADRDPAGIRRRALDDPLLRGDLVSEDGTVTAVVVSFDEDRIDEIRGATIQRIHDLVDPALPAGMRAYYNGSLEISETYNRVTLDNQRVFTPPILLVTVLALFATFRSWRKTALTMVAVLVSVVWTLGLYSLAGYTFNVLSSMLIPLVIVLAIADDVHILQHYDRARREGDAEDAFKATVSHLVVPLLGASGTTALGMLSLATSDVVAVRSFGIGAAMGVMADFAISLVFVPTVLGWLEPDAVMAPHERHLVEPLRRVARFSCSRPGLVLGVAAALGLSAGAGLTHLRVDTNHINFFRPRHPLSESAAIIDGHLSGIYSFQILLEGEPDALKQPAALRRIERLSDGLRQLPFVKKVSSVAEYVTRVNRELHGGDPAAARVPGDPDLVAQELFVFGLSDEGRYELERMVASDYSKAQVSVKLVSMSSDLVFAQIETAERLAAEAFAGSGIRPTVTGSGRLFATLDHYLVVSQFSSFGTAFVTVFAVIFLIFRSAKFGILTIVPNLFPVLAVLGIMGWIDISMNVATIMLASVALGVVDDDTIHFINRYRHEIGAGAGTDEAIELATVHEGRASLTTALINSCGFGVLALSEYRPSAWFGGLLALTMAVAFLAEVFILPATIKMLPGVFGADRLRRARPAVQPASPGCRPW